VQQKEATVRLRDEEAAIFASSRPLSFVFTFKHSNTQTFKLFLRAVIARKAG